MVGSVLAVLGIELERVNASLRVVVPGSDSYPVAVTANAADVAPVDDGGAVTVVESTVDGTGPPMDVVGIGADADGPTTDDGVVVPASAGTG